jgi:hypothetical protein
VRLVIQVEAVRDQFFDIDLRRSVRPLIAEVARTTATALFAATISAAARAFSLIATARRVAARTIATGRAIVATATFFGFLLFYLCHVESLKLEPVDWLYQLPAARRAHSTPTRAEGRNLNPAVFLPTKFAITALRTLFSSFPREAGMTRESRMNVRHGLSTRTALLRRVARAENASR